MRKPRLLAAAMLALASCSSPSSTENGKATDEALAAIALPEEQFRALLRQSVLVTQSAGMHMYALGLEDGCNVLDEAVDEVVGENLPQWRSNLLAAYRASVPEEQLARAVEAGPRAAREMLAEHLPELATAMQRASEPLLKEAAVEVLTATGEAAAKVDRASVDGAARQKELQSALASGQICGGSAPRQQ